MTREIKLRNYHAQVWDEPLIMDLSVKGQRGILPPESEEEIRAAVGDAEGLIPAAMRRTRPPELPEVAQPQVVRHYTRLSQMTMGNDVSNDVGVGTCTMKYSPKVNEQLCALPEMAELHPCQNESTVQGILEILYRTRDFLREISGMDEVSFQPASGGQAVLTAAAIARAYHEAAGEGRKRDQVITTIHSHPVDAACPATLGYEVVTLMPDKDGYPDLEALKAAVSERTAALMITNPEDIGLYNPRIDEFVRIVHAAGGLCFTDQANANGVLGKARAADAGFDMCHFNLHKTFSSPHGGMGPGCGALAVKEKLAKFLPLPVVTFNGRKYGLDFKRPRSIGKVRDFYGNVPVVLRTYAWIMSLGAKGLETVAETAVINNNYLESLLLAIPGVTESYGPGKIRLDQIRYSWEKLAAETGVTSEDIERRMTDFGIQSYWLSHHPMLIPEPFTPEPTESYSKEEIEYWAAVMRHIDREAREDPQKVKSAPHRGITTKIDESAAFFHEKCMFTYKKYRREKEGKRGE
ncbi:MAG: aminomethyl-transferring glycine dehydrogenase subunit GcvPB [bacterium]